MLFNSPEFLLGLLPAALLVFFILGRFHAGRGAIVWLTIISIVFYAWWNPIYVPLLVGSIVINFMIGELLRTRPTRLWLIGGVALNVALLAYFKYTDFLLGSVAQTIGVHWRPPAILLPLAISFFTFQQIAYLVDCHDGLVKKSNFLSYCAFITFFPHLIAGPITHHKEIIPQLESRKILSPQPLSIALGLTIFLVGLLKKTTIADPLSTIANPVFDAAAHGDKLSIVDAWGGTLAYTLQLYFDFSGYSDMAIGAALMFGIRLPINFNSPFKAANIADFWQRWHITLTRFITSYIYNPIVLSRSRRRMQQGKKPVQPGRNSLRSFIGLTAMPTMVSMGISGLWHGAGWTFLAWGLLHGVYIVCYHVWREISIRLGFGKGSSRGKARIASVALTFFCVLVSMVLFRSSDLAAAGTLLADMFAVHGLVLPDKLVLMPHIASALAALNIQFTGPPLIKVSRQGIILAVLLISTWALPNVYQWLRNYDTALMTKPSLRPVKLLPGIGMAWQPNVACAVIIGMMGFLGLLKALSHAPTEFIYFRF